MDVRSAPRTVSYSGFVVNTVISWMFIIVAFILAIFAVTQLPNLGDSLTIEGTDTATIDLKTDSDEYSLTIQKDGAFQLLHSGSKLIEIDSTDAIFSTESVTVTSMAAETLIVSETMSVTGASTFIQSVTVNGDLTVKGTLVTSTEKEMQVPSVSTDSLSNSEGTLSISSSEALQLSSSNTLELSSSADLQLTAEGQLLLQSTGSSVTVASPLSVTGTVTATAVSSPTLSTTGNTLTLSSKREVLVDANLLGSSGSSASFDVMKASTNVTTGLIGSTGALSIRAGSQTDAIAMTGAVSVTGSLNAASATFTSAQASALTAGTLTTTAINSAGSIKIQPTDTLTLTGEVVVSDSLTAAAATFTSAQATSFTAGALSTTAINSAGSIKIQATDTLNLAGSVAVTGSLDLTDATSVSLGTANAESVTAETLTSDIVKSASGKTLTLRAGDGTQSLTVEAATAFLPSISSPSGSIKSLSATTLSVNSTSSDTVLVRSITSPEALAIRAGSDGTQDVSITANQVNVGKLVSSSLTTGTGDFTAGTFRNSVTSPVVQSASTLTIQAGSDGSNTISVLASAVNVDNKLTAETLVASGELTADTANIDSDLVVGAQVTVPVVQSASGNLVVKAATGSTVSIPDATVTDLTASDLVVENDITADTVTAATMTVTNDLTVTDDILATSIVSSGNFTLDTNSKTLIVKGTVSSDTALIAPTAALTTATATTSVTTPKVTTVSDMRLETTDGSKSIRIAVGTSTTTDTSKIVVSSSSVQFLAPITVTGNATATSFNSNSYSNDGSVYYDVVKSQDTQNFRVGGQNVFQVASGYALSNAAHNVSTTLNVGGAINVGSDQFFKVNAGTHTVGVTGALSASTFSSTSAAVSGALSAGSLAIGSLAVASDGALTASTGTFTTLTTTGSTTLKSVTADSATISTGNMVVSTGNVDLTTGSVLVRSGTVNATNGVFVSTGNITATAGRVFGKSLASETLSVTGSTDATKKFAVDVDGAVTAPTATFSGQVTAATFSSPAASLTKVTATNIDATYVDSTNGYFDYVNSTTAVFTTLSGTTSVTSPLGLITSIQSSTISSSALTTTALSTSTLAASTSVTAPTIGSAATTALVGNTLNINGGLTVASTGHVTSALNVDGAVTATSTMAVAGASTFGSAVTVGGQSTFANTVNVLAGMQLGSSSFDFTVSRPSHSSSDGNDLYITGQDSYAHPSTSKDGGDVVIKAGLTRSTPVGANGKVILSAGNNELTVASNLVTAPVLAATTFSSTTGTFTNLASGSVTATSATAATIAATTSLTAATATITDGTVTTLRGTTATFGSTVAAATLQSTTFSATSASVATLAASASVTSATSVSAPTLSATSALSSPSATITTGTVNTLTSTTATLTTAGVSTLTATTFNGQVGTFSSDLTVAGTVYASSIARPMATLSGSTTTISGQNANSGAAAALNGGNVQISAGAAANGGVAGAVVLQSGVGSAGPKVTIDSTGTTVANGLTSDSLTVTNGITTGTLSSTGITVSNSLTLGGTTDFTIVRPQQATVGATGANTILRGQQAALGNLNGGGVQIIGGLNTGTGASGSVLLQSGDNTLTLADSSNKLTLNAASNLEILGSATVAASLSSTTFTSTNAQITQADVTNLDSTGYVNAPLVKGATLQMTGAASAASFSATSNIAAGGTVSATTFAATSAVSTTDLTLSNIKSDAVVLGNTDAAFTLSRPQHASSTGLATTISGQQGRSGYNGGDLILASGAGGSVSDVAGRVSLAPGGTTVAYATPDNFTVIPETTFYNLVHFVSGTEGAQFDQVNAARTQILSEDVARMTLTDLAGMGAGVHVTADRTKESATVFLNDNNMDGAWANVRGAGTDGSFELRRQMWYKLSTVDNVNRLNDENKNGQKIIRMASQAQISSCVVSSSNAPCTSTNFPDGVYVRVRDSDGTNWIIQEIDYISNSNIYLVANLAVNTGSNSGSLVDGSDIEIWEPYVTNYDEVFTPVTRFNVDNDVRAFNTPILDLTAAQSSSNVHTTTAVHINSNLGSSASLRLASVEDSTYQGYTMTTDGVEDPSLTLQSTNGVNVLLKGDGSDTPAYVEVRSATNTNTYLTLNDQAGKGTVLTADSHYSATLTISGYTISANGIVLATTSAAHNLVDGAAYTISGSSGTKDTALASIDSKLNAAHTVRTGKSCLTATCSTSQFEFTLSTSPATGAATTTTSFGTLDAGRTIFSVQSTANSEVVIGGAAGKSASLTLGDDAATTASLNLNSGASQDITLQFSDTATNTNDDFAIRKTGSSLETRKQVRMTFHEDSQVTRTSTTTRTFVPTSYRGVVQPFSSISVASGNVATVTFSFAHGFVAGDDYAVVGTLGLEDSADASVNGGSIDGFYELTSVTSTTATFTLPVTVNNGAITSTSSNLGSMTPIALVRDGMMAISGVTHLGGASIRLTFASTHSFASGSYIQIANAHGAKTNAGVAVDLNGFYEITGVTGTTVDVSLPASVAGVANLAFLATGTTSFGHAFETIAGGFAVDILSMTLTSSGLATVNLVSRHNLINGAKYEIADASSVTDAGAKSLDSIFNGRHTVATGASCSSYCSPSQFQIQLSGSFTAGSAAAATSFGTIVLVDAGRLDISTITVSGSRAQLVLSSKHNLVSRREYWIANAFNVQDSAGVAVSNLATGAFTVYTGIDCQLGSTTSDGVCSDSQVEIVLTKADGTSYATGNLNPTTGSFGYIANGDYIQYGSYMAPIYSLTNALQIDHAPLTAAVADGDTFYIVKSLNSQDNMHTLTRFETDRASFLAPADQSFTVTVGDGAQFFDLTMSTADLAGTVANSQLTLAARGLTSSEAASVTITSGGEADAAVTIRSGNAASTGNYEAAMILSNDMYDDTARTLNDVHGDYALVHTQDNLAFRKQAWQFVGDLTSSTTAASGVAKIATPDWTTKLFPGDHIRLVRRDNTNYQGVGALISAGDSGAASAPWNEMFATVALVETDGVTLTADLDYTVYAGDQIFVHSRYDASTGARSAETRTLSAFSDLINVNVDDKTVDPSSLLTLTTGSDDGTRTIGPDQNAAYWHTHTTAAFVAKETAALDAANTGAQGVTTLKLQDNQNDGFSITSDNLDTPTLTISALGASSDNIATQVTVSALNTAAASLKVTSGTGMESGLILDVGSARNAASGDYALTAQAGHFDIEKQYNYQQVRSTSTSASKMSVYYADYNTIKAVSISGTTVTVTLNNLPPAGLTSISIVGSSLVKSSDSVFFDLNGVFSVGVSQSSTTVSFTLTTNGAAGSCSVATGGSFGYLVASNGYNQAGQNKVKATIAQFYQVTAISVAGASATATLDRTHSLSSGNQYYIKSIVGSSNACYADGYVTLTGVTGTTITFATTCGTTPTATNLGYITVSGLATNDPNFSVFEQDASLLVQAGDDITIGANTYRVTAVSSTSNSLDSVNGYVVLTLNRNLEATVTRGASITLSKAPRVRPYVDTGAITVTGSQATISGGVTAFLLISISQDVTTIGTSSSDSVQTDARLAQLVRPGDKVRIAAYQYTDSGTTLDQAGSAFAASGINGRGDYRVQLQVDKTPDGSASLGEITNIAVGDFVAFGTGAAPTSIDYVVTAISGKILTLHRALEEVHTSSAKVFVKKGFNVYGADRVVSAVTNYDSNSDGVVDQQKIFCADFNSVDIPADLKIYVKQHSGDDTAAGLGAKIDTNMLYLSNSPAGTGANYIQVGDEVYLGSFTSTFYSVVAVAANYIKLDRNIELSDTYLVHDDLLYVKKADHTGAGWANPVKVSIDESTTDIATAVTIELTAAGTARLIGANAVAATPSTYEHLDTVVTLKAGNLGSTDNLYQSGAVTVNLQDSTDGYSISSDNVDSGSSVFGSSLTISPISDYTNARAEVHVRSQADADSVVSIDSGSAGSSALTLSANHLSATVNTFDVEYVAESSSAPSGEVGDASLVHESGTTAIRKQLRSNQYSAVSAAPIDSSVNKAGQNMISVDKYLGSALNQVQVGDELLIVGQYVDTSCVSGACKFIVYKVKEIQTHPTDSNSHLLVLDQNLVADAVSRVVEVQYLTFTAPTATATIGGVFTLSMTHPDNAGTVNDVVTTITTTTNPLPLAVGSGLTAASLQTSVAALSNVNYATVSRAAVDSTHNIYTYEIAFNGVNGALANQFAITQDVSIRDIAVLAGGSTARLTLNLQSVTTTFTAGYYYISGGATILASDGSTDISSEFNADVIQVTAQSTDGDGYVTLTVALSAVRPVGNIASAATLPSISTVYTTTNAGGRASASMITAQRTAGVAGSAVYVRKAAARDHQNALRVDVPETLTHFANTASNKNTLATQVAPVTVTVAADAGTRIRTADVTATNGHRDTTVTFTAGKETDSGSTVLVLQDSDLDGYTITSDGADSAQNPQETAKLTIAPQGSATNRKLDVTFAAKADEHATVRVTAGTTHEAQLVMDVGTYGNTATNDLAVARGSGYAELRRQMPFRLLTGQPVHVAATANTNTVQIRVTNNYNQLNNGWFAFSTVANRVQSSDQSNLIEFADATNVNVGDTIASVAAISTTYTVVAKSGNIVTLDRYLAAATATGAYWAVKTPTLAVGDLVYFNGVTSNVYTVTAVSTPYPYIDTQTSVNNNANGRHYLITVTLDRRFATVADVTATKTVHVQKGYASSFTSLVGITASETINAVDRPLLTLAAGNSGSQATTTTASLTSGSNSNVQVNLGDGLDGYSFTVSTAQDAPVMTLQAFSQDGSSSAHNAAADLRIQSATDATVSLAMRDATDMNGYTTTVTTDVRAPGSYVNQDRVPIFSIVIAGDGVTATITTVSAHGITDSLGSYQFVGQTAIADSAAKSATADFASPLAVTYISATQISVQMPSQPFTAGQIDGTNLGYIVVPSRTTQSPNPRQTIASSAAVDTTFQATGTNSATVTVLAGDNDASTAEEAAVVYDLGAAGADFGAMSTVLTNLGSTPKATSFDIRHQNNWLEIVAVGAGSLVPRGQKHITTSISVTQGRADTPFAAMAIASLSDNRFALTDAGTQAKYFQAGAIVRGTAGTNDYTLLYDSYVCEIGDDASNDDLCMVVHRNPTDIADGNFIKLQQPTLEAGDLITLGSSSHIYRVYSASSTDIYLETGLLENFAVGDAIFVRKGASSDFSNAVSVQIPHSITQAAPGALLTLTAAAVDGAAASQEYGTSTTATLTAAGYNSPVALAMTDGVDGYTVTVNTDMQTVGPDATTAQKALTQDDYAKYTISTAQTGTTADVVVQGSGSDADARVTIASSGSSSEAALVLDDSSSGKFAMAHSGSSLSFRKALDYFPLKYGVGTGGPHAIGSKTIKLNADTISSVWATPNTLVDSNSINGQEYEISVSATTSGLSGGNFQLTWGGASTTIAYTSSDSTVRSTLISAYSNSYLAVSSVAISNGKKYTIVVYQAPSATHTAWTVSDVDLTCTAACGAKSLTAAQTAGTYNPYYDISSGGNGVRLANTNDASKFTVGDIVTGDSGTTQYAIVSVGSTYLFGTAKTVLYLDRPVSSGFTQGGSIKIYQPLTEVGDEILLNGDSTVYKIIKTSTAASVTTLVLNRALVAAFADSTTVSIRKGYADKLEDVITIDLPDTVYKSPRTLLDLTAASSSNSVTDVTMTLTSGPLGLITSTLTDGYDGYTTIVHPDQNSAYIQHRTVAPATSVPYDLRLQSKGTDQNVLVKFEDSTGTDGYQLTVSTTTAPAATFAAVNSAGSAPFDLTLLSDSSAENVKITFRDSASDDGYKFTVTPSASDYVVFEAYDSSDSTQAFDMTLKSQGTDNTITLTMTDNDASPDYIRSVYTPDDTPTTQIYYHNNGNNAIAETIQYSESTSENRITLLDGNNDGFRISSFTATTPVAKTLKFQAQDGGATAGIAEFQFVSVSDATPTAAQVNLRFLDNQNSDAYVMQADTGATPQLQFYPDGTSANIAASMWFRSKGTGSNVVLKLVDQSATPAGYTVTASTSGSGLTMANSVSSTATSVIIGNQAASTSLTVSSTGAGASGTISGTTSALTLTGTTTTSTLTIDGTTTSTLTMSGTTSNNIQYTTATTGINVLTFPSGLATGFTIKDSAATSYINFVSTGTKSISVPVPSTFSGAATFTTSVSFADVPDFRSGDGVTVARQNRITMTNSYSRSGVASFAAVDTELGKVDTALDNIVTSFTSLMTIFANYGLLV
eukprot:TRINITY_DN2766_c0_g1::TRINITY_DN2766_c0_g1_i1::g.27836::m.27836 TRINITY_DN2766_c0_g1::TRINITY_DN2766_c0_g1_i1::g.27836  ORF type:complete len:6179 (-),score=2783.55,OstA/PF03968.9/1e+04,OstA/PF03968.9/2.9e+03,OstA/PF03968.9/0.59,OstA/PF03968.9/6.6e+03 TRINITY_DN2766_c0_g1_i1:241-18777(-)